MATKGDLEAVAQLWIRMSAAAGGVPGRTVILADQGGPQLPEAYAVIRVESWDVVEGVDETLQAEDPGSGDPVLITRGQRSAVVSVETFGAGAEDWIRRAVMALSLPTIQAVTSEAGFTISTIDGSGIVNLSALLDESAQGRHQRDFSVTYDHLVTLVVDSDPLAEVAEVEHTDTFASESPAGDMIQVATIDLT